MRPSKVPGLLRISLLLMLAAGPLPLRAQISTSPAQRASLVRSSSGAAFDAQPPNMQSTAAAPSLPAAAWTATPPAAPHANSMVVTASGLSDERDANIRNTSLASGASTAGAVQSDGSLQPVATARRTPLNPTRREAEEAADVGGAKSTVQMLVSMGSSLLIVLGLFLGAAWFYRKTINTSLGSSIPKQVVDVLGRTPIAARQQLVLVRFGSKLVLVSIVQGEARAISEIDEPLEVDRLTGLCESSKPGSISQSFRSVLTQGGSA